MTKRTIFNKHFLHYFYLDRDIKKAVERYSYTDGWTLDTINKDETLTQNYVTVAYKNE